MAIIREWRCNDCGTEFESAHSDPMCPTCTADQPPERVFLTAPSIRHEKTTVSDQVVKGLASDFGMSDLNNRGGQPVKQARSDNPTQFAGPQLVQKMNIPQGARDQFSAVRSGFRLPTQWDRQRAK